MYVRVIAAVMFAIPAAAQDAPRRSARVVDPIEFNRPPKKHENPTPTQVAFYQSPVLKKLDSKDPKVLADVVRDISTFIQRDPTDPDFYFLRATVSCQIHGDKNALLNDIDQSVKLRTPGKFYVYDSLTDHYALKARVEFDLARYQEAMNDLDAAIRIDYTKAPQLFNDGNTKPNQPTATPCVWKQADFNTLARLFPKGYRPSLYTGLYLLNFSRFSLDTDYQPILKAFEQSAALNPSSALPLYFMADSYILGGIGGMLSKSSASCIDDVVPRTEACLALDALHRTGVRYLTRAIAADPTFAPGYEMRALALFQLRQSRQAVRDYNKVLELNPNANVYNDRALAEMDLKEYQAAIQDYTKAIANGCDKSLCFSYENRADAYLKLHDYPHAVSDISQTVGNFLADTMFNFNIDQFRRIYPEYDDLPDDVLCEKLRAQFFPEMTYADYSKQFLVAAKEVDDFVLPELFLKRGDAYADMGNLTNANQEYDRVSAGYPKWAKNAFKIQPDGTRIRIRQ